MDKLSEGYVALFYSVVEGHSFAHGSVVVPRPSEGDYSCVCIVYANRYVHLKPRQIISYHRFTGEYTMYIERNVDI